MTKTIFFSAIVLTCLAGLNLACYEILGVTPSTKNVQAIHNCIIGKGANDYGDDKKYANSLLECLNGDRDNLDCCRREGVKGDCLRLCNGTVPQNIEVDRFDALRVCKSAFKCLKFGLDQASG